MTRTVRWAGLGLPACIHPDGCDTPQAPNVHVCREHMPEPFQSLEEIAPRIGEFRVRQRGNGYAVEHWTGAHLPVPVHLEHPWLGGMVNDAWMVPRWVAEEALGAYGRGELPGPYVQTGEGVERAEPPVGELTLFDAEEVAA